MAMCPPSSAGIGFIGQYDLAGTIDSFDHIDRSAGLGSDSAGLDHSTGLDRSAGLGSGR